MTACPGNGHQALPTHGSGCPRAVAEHALYTVHPHRVQGVLHGNSTSHQVAPAFA
jgi:hypothetical protein